MEYLIFVGCLAATLTATVFVVRVAFRQRLPRWQARRCVRCRGSGWTARRERTLDFTGTEFADIEYPSTMCTACGGSGKVLRREGRGDGPGLG